MQPERVQAVTLCECVLKGVGGVARRQVLVIGVGGFSDDGAVDDPEAPATFDPLDVRTIAAGCADAFSRLDFTLAGGGPLIDVDSAVVKSSITALTGRHDVGPIVVHFIGHGGVDRVTGRYHIAGIDARPGSLTVSGVDVCGILDSLNSDPDGPPVLLVLDACESGRAVRYLMGQDRHDDQRRAWAFAASHPVEPAMSCRFSRALRRVLRRIADGAVDLTVTEPFVRLEMVRDLVQAELDLDTRAGSVRQVAEFSSPSTAHPVPPFIPNPHFDRVAAGRRERMRALVPDPAARAVLDEIVDPEHFRSRASGLLENRWQVNAGGVPRCLFTGRGEIMTALSAWLAGSSTQPGMLRVVTGSPGSGKSALLGALVCAAHPQLREAAPEVAARLSGARRPPRIRRMAVLHARNRTAFELRRSIGHQLGLLEPPDGNWSIAYLVDRLRWLIVAPVIVIDALDEADRPDELLSEVLAPVVKGHKVRLLVGTRKGPTCQALLDTASDQQGLIDLDEVAAKTIRADLTEYIAELLTGSHHYRRERHAQRVRIAATTAMALTAPESRFGSEFLAAGLFVDYLDGLPDPVHDLADIATAVPNSLDKLVELRLARLGTGQVWLRPVLAALAHAKGIGMPRTVLSIAAPVFAPKHVRTSRIDDSQIAEAIRAAQFYLRRSIDDDGTTLYRLFHQALDDHLRACPMDPLELVPDSAAFSATLLDRLLADITLPVGAGRLFRAWDRAVPYVLRHAIEHAADAGRVDELILDPEFLVHADPGRLYPHLAAAQNRTAQRYATVYRTSRHIRHDSWHCLVGRITEDRSAVRRDLLTVDAMRWRVPELAVQLASRPFVPRWATGNDLTTIFHGKIETLLNGITTLAATVSGKSVIAIGCDENGSLERWDLLTGQRLGDQIYGAGALGVDFATVNGHDVFVTGGDAVRVWDLATGQRLAELATGHVGRVLTVATTILRGVPVAVSGGDDGTLRLTDLSTGHPVGAPLPGPVNRSSRSRGFRRMTRSVGDDRPCAVFGLSITRMDGSPVAVAIYDDGTLRLWELATGRPVGDPMKCSSPYGFIARLFWRACGMSWYTETLYKIDAFTTTVIGDCPIAVTSHRNGMVLAWNLVAQQAIGPPMTGHTERVLTVSTGVLGDTPVAITGDENGTARIWDLTTHRMIGEPLKSRVRRIAASTAVRLGDRTIAATASSRAVHIWDLTAARDAVGKPVAGHSGEVRAICTGVLAGRPIVITGCDDGSVRFWDLATGQPIREWLLGDQSVPLSSVALGSFKRRPVLATGYEGYESGAVVVWNLASGRPIHRQVIHRAFVLGKAVVVTMLDDRLVAFAHGPDESVRAWDVRTGQAAGPALAGCHGLDAIALTSYQNRPTAAVSSNEQVGLWDLPTGQPVGHLMPDSVNSWVATATIVRGRPVILANDFGGHTVRMWDPIAGREIRRTLVMPEPVTALCASQQGELIVGMQNGDITTFSVNWPQDADW
jgi:WD40 repeat protein